MFFASLMPLFAQLNTSIHMKRTILLALATIISFTGLSAQQKQADVFVPIGKYIQLGDAEKLSAWFASNLELDILGSVSSCSKVQATQIMKDFFVNYTPKAFSVIHKSGKAPLTYAIGCLSAGGEKFRITLFVMTQEKGNQIQQLRIERE